ncbi:Hypothetical protein CINCED_3A025197 [Cinara cedri]|uniref:HMG box domain-containing protein n=1 Tax=Cinara cedri TaxID=506608 RepID=A0A5E4N8S7_9HEMI|nr:Hypothetical protein CINCED_3A025197 [Cinara cedri]
MGEPDITTVVSRSGRVIKRSSKLLGFESPDLQEKDKTPTKQSKQVTKRQSFSQEPLAQFNDNSNMEFLKDQQNTEGNKWSVDTNPFIDEYTESSGSSVSVKEHNQFMYAVENLNMDKSEFVSFSLWATEVKKTLMNAYPNYSSSQIKQQLNEMWKSVPNEDKIRWVQKAKRLLDDELDESTSNGIKDTAEKSSTKIINNLTDTNDIMKCQTKSKILNPTQPIHVAAHLALLGESLTKIGQRLKEHQGQIAVNGSVSVLLDSLLCTLGPLMCLTQQVPELNVNSQETLSKIMDDIAYIMPGL